VRLLLFPIWVQAREGVGALMTAIGPEAVSTALVAACWARLFLETDGLDIRLVLTTRKIEKTGGDGATMQLEAVLVRVYVDEC
jgi:stage V sporulation protein SpoVS